MLPAYSQVGMRLTKAIVVVGVEHHDANAVQPAGALQRTRQHNIDKVPAAGRKLSLGLLGAAEVELWVFARLRLSPNPRIEPLQSSVSALASFPCLPRMRVGGRSKSLDRLSMQYLPFRSVSSLLPKQTEST